MTVGAFPAGGVLPAPLLAVAVPGLVGVVFLGELLRRFALRRGFVDEPTRRKPHQNPTPYLGGVAIAAGTLLPATVLLPLRATGLVAILVAAAAVSTLGLADDVRPLSPALRLGVESAAAAAVVATGVRLPVFGGTFGAAFSVVWIVLFTNAFNLLDNMDGAAAAVGAAASAGLAATAAALGRGDLAVLLCALGAACAGFLFHNWTPARMFMGDAGSLFVGFVIAASAVAILATRPAIPALTAAWLILFVPAVDTSIVLLSRHRARRPLLSGGTDHLSHRLRLIGFSVPQVSLILFTVTAATSSAGSLVARGVLPAAQMLPPVIAAAVALTSFMLRVPVY